MSERTLEIKIKVGASEEEITAETSRLREEIAIRKAEINQLRLALGPGRAGRDHHPARAASG